MEHLSVAIADDNQRILDLMEEIINMDKERSREGKEWRRDVSDYQE